MRIFVLLCNFRKEFNSFWVSELTPFFYLVIVCLRRYILTFLQKLLFFLTFVLNNLRYLLIYFFFLLMFHRFYLLFLFYFILIFYLFIHYISLYHWIMKSCWPFKVIFSPFISYIFSVCIFTQFFFSYIRCSHVSSHILSVVIFSTHMAQSLTSFSNWFNSTPDCRFQDVLLYLLGLLFLAL